MGRRLAQITSFIQRLDSSHNVLDIHWMYKEELLVQMNGR
jgi:hypothetical protein